MLPLWNRITSFQRTTNMRFQSHPSFQDFSLSIGEGATRNYVEIPYIMVATENSVEGHTHEIFGDGQNFDKIKNDDAQMRNSKVLNLIPGDSTHCYSADFVNEEEAGTYPVKF
jgi:hypothetical protein